MTPVGQMLIASPAEEVPCVNADLATLETHSSTVNWNPVVKTPAGQMPNVSPRDAQPFANVPEGTLETPTQTVSKTLAQQTHVVRKEVTIAVLIYKSG